MGVSADSNESKPTLVKHECIYILFMQIRDIYILPILVSRLLFLWATPAHQPLLYILTRNSH